MNETRAPRSGIFVIAPIDGAVGERIAEVHRTHDPRLLKLGPPHVTLIGSSGAGPISPQTTVDELRARLEPITRETSPIGIRFEPPTRFMQTEIVVLPLDPHGALRELHERIKRSGFQCAKPRFYFTPHVTLSLYRELPRNTLSKLLLQRFDEATFISRLECHLTSEMSGSIHLLTLQLAGDTSHEAR